MITDLLAGLIIIAGWLLVVDVIFRAIPKTKRR
jgi:hypothetical protein